MHILYDGQIYAAQKIGGISRYFTNLISLLPETVNPTVAVPYHENRLHFPDHKNLTLREFRNFKPNWVSKRAQSFYFRKISNTDSTHFDLHHPTYYSRLSRDDFNQIRSPLVITVYDMIHERFPDTLEPGGLVIRAKREAISAASAIICISNSTKTDLIKFFPEVESKITVTHLASEFSQDWSYGAEPVPERPYFLYVGSRTKAYKNFDTLLIAFSKVALSQPDVCLAVVGSHFDKDERTMISEFNLDDRILYYEMASDHHLAKLYRCSMAFIYPSLVEGFGIPPLEAMICGTPVVAANSSSIPEVVGEAGMLFEPKLINDLTDILLNLLDSSAQRDRLVNKGYEQSQKFSWHQTVDKTMQVYRSVT